MTSISECGITRSLIAIAPLLTSHRDVETPQVLTLDRSIDPMSRHPMDVITAFNSWRHLATVNITIRNRNNVSSQRKYR